jgi:hypothetical protein
MIPASYRPDEEDSDCIAQAISNIDEAENSFQQ